MAADWIVARKLRIRAATPPPPFEKRALATPTAANDRENLHLQDGLIQPLHACCGLGSGNVLIKIDMRHRSFPVCHSHSHHNATTAGHQNQYRRTCHQTASAAVVASRAWYGSRWCAVP